MTTDTIDQLNGCLRGEISAVETYKMALKKLEADHHPGLAAQLQTLQREHGLASQQIRDRIVNLGGEAEDGSGAWGAFAKAVQGTADLFGDTAALKSLKEGEEHGLSEYESLLSDVDLLDPVSRGLLGRLAEQQRRHVDTVDMLMAAV